MRSIAWSPALDTGDRLVDEQHQGLVALFNELLVAEQQGDHGRVPDALERLSEYAVVHFTAEECLMAEHDYPHDAVESHLAEHRALRSRTRDLVLEYRAGKLTTIVPIVEFMNAWLTEHIEMSDRRLVAHVHGASTSADARGDAS